MYNQVIKCNDVDRENKIVNESLTSKVVDFENPIHSLKLQLNATVKGHKTLSTTVDVLKMESKAKEDKYLKEIIELEKKKKALENVVYKMGQSTQTMHMLTKPQTFYDESHKKALGYQNPLYLTQAQRKVPTLYCGHTIIKQHDALSVIDTEETLIMTEESRLKMHAKQNDPIAKEKKVNIAHIDYVALNKPSEHFAKQFMPQKQLSAEHAFWLPISKSVYEKPLVQPEPILKEIPRELPPISLVKDSFNKIRYVNQFDEVITVRVIIFTNASGSKPPGNTKKNRISRPTSSYKKNKVEDHLRSVQSSFNKKNLISEPVCNANVMHSILNVNFELICSTCNECMFNAIHDLCVVNYLNNVNERAKSKFSKSNKKKNWKPTVKQGHLKGLLGLKYQKDHLCYACSLGKSKKHTHKPKSDDSIQEKLYLFHMNLCGLMRIESINGKKYIVVIVNDYSRFTWILHQSSAARTPQQNDAVKRRNRTLVEAAGIMQTRLIMESIHVEFDELIAMVSEQFGSGPELQLMTSGTIRFRIEAYRSMAEEQDEQQQQQQNMMNAELVLINELLLSIQSTWKSLKDLHPSKLLAEAKSKGVIDDEVDFEETKEDEEEPLVITRPIRVVTGGESHRESEEEGVHDELTFKSSNGGASVLPNVLDDPSDYSSGSSSNYKFAIKDISHDEAEVTEKADDAKKADVEKDTKEQVADEQDAKKYDGGKEHCDDQRVSPTQPPQTQPKRRKLKIILKKSMKPDTQVDSGELKNRVTRLEKKVHVMSSFNLPEAIDKFVKAHLKNVLPKDVLDFGKIKIEKAAKKSITKYSATPFDPIALMIYDLKDNLFKMMREYKVYNRHPAHKALYDALVVFLSVDEDNIDKHLKNLSVQKKRRMDDHDQDPPAYADKESKKKKRKDFDTPSSKITKDQPTSSKKCTTPSKTSKPDKSMQPKETVEELD
nr:hypothetical protein [Tanacetum cinerariifolium]